MKKNINDACKILLDCLDATSKKLDRFLFILIVTTVYSLISFIEQTNEFEISLISLKIQEPVYYYTLLGITIISIFAVVGSNIINYIIKRFAFGLEIRRLPEENRDILFELLPSNIYEFIYGELLGKRFEDRKRLNDKSRIISCWIIAITLIAINFSSLWCSFEIWGINSTNGENFQMWAVTLLTITFVFSVFLWASFFQTLKRRVTRIKAWKLTEALRIEQP